LLKPGLKLYVDEPAEASHHKEQQGHGPETGQQTHAGHRQSEDGARAQEQKPAVPRLEHSASNIPTSIPAATLEIHPPNAVGEENRLLAMYARPRSVARQAEVQDRGEQEERRRVRLS